MFKNRKLSSKLLLSFLLIGVLPALIVAISSLMNGAFSLSKAEYSRLESLKNTKAMQIENLINEQNNSMNIILSVVKTYEEEGRKNLETINKLQKENIIRHFELLSNEIQNFSELKITINALEMLSSYIKKYNNNETMNFDIDSKDYTSLNEKLNISFQKLSENSNFSDIYIIDADSSKLVYTNSHGKDLGTNLKYGEYNNTGLARVYQNALKTQNIVFEDYSEYSPLNNESSLFIAHLIRYGEKTFVIATRYKKDSINKIIQNRNGLGLTGETYLAGEKDNVKSFRSDILTIGNGKYVVGFEGDFELEYWNEAFSGKKVQKIFTDSQGKLVMVLAEPIREIGLNWIIVTKMDLEEIIGKKLKENSGDIYNEFSNKFNFSDILLIHPSGEVFYSVDRKEDYHSNVLNGKLSETNLNKLVKKIKNSKESEIVDFALYEPADDNPAAFMGIPLLENNEIVLIIVLEFFEDKINEIMKSSEQLSKTGESYLVGEDYLMKSDSRREPDIYSLRNSLLNPQKTKILTEPVKEALKGNEDTIITHNYLGEKVISSFKKLEINGLNWIIISELNTSEAFKSVNNLRNFIFLVAVLGIIFIIFVSYKITREIVDPIVKLELWANEIAEGKNNIITVTDFKNEIGNLNTSFTSVVTSIQEATEICRDISMGDFSKPFNVRSENDPLGEAINQMRASFLAVISQADQLAKGDFSIEIQKRSEDDNLAIALINLVSALKVSTRKNERESWIKTGQSKLYDIIREEKKIETLSTDIISFLSKYTGAKMGAIFIKTPEQDEFYLSGSYAYTFRKSSDTNFHKGEGILGQSLIEQEIFVINNLPEDYIYIKSGLGNSVPKNIIVIPCVYNKNVKAVIELAFINNINDLVVEFFKTIRENIAIAIHTAEAKDKMNELLDRTIKQSEELQYQQETLKQTNEELEEQTLLLKKEKESVAQQNRDLEEIKTNLEKKSIELQQSSKYKSEFLANMSHELRTPLNSILILAKLLSENKTDNLTKKQIEKVNTIYKSGHDLLDLINEVLDLSKIEAGKTELDIAEFEILSSVEFFEKSFRAIADQKALEFKIHINDDIPPIIKNDERKLSQILKNMLSNAFKFTEKGEVQFNIYGESEVEKNKKKDYIVFEVRDTGIGISKAVQGSIFEAFKQADGSTSRKYGGTGLGLSISKNLAELLGGRLELESEENKGSTFKMYLPIEMNNYLNDFKRDTEQKRSFVTVNSNKKEDLVVADYSSIEDDKDNIDIDDKVVLIVEDDSDFANVLLELSRENGYKGIISLTGADAIEMVEKYYPQGILLDLGLPDTDGWTILGKIKNNLKSRHIPVYIISGNENAGLGLKLGAAGFIKKPAELEELYNAFEKLEFINRKELRNILIVEDNQEQLELLSDVFSKTKQIQLDSATTGNKAIECINNKKYDCIVLDLSLPDINGMELLDMLNKTGKISETPIIIYTARELTKEEKSFLETYSEKIIIKNADSHEELLDQVTLFLHIMEDNLSEKNKKIINEFKEKGSEFKGKKVLVVDDDVRNIFALTSVLEEKEIEVFTAENGKVAIEVLEQNSDINMIIMDIMMPVMDGYEAMRRIREIEKFKTLPIIALTAKAMKDDYNNCIEAGASDYLTKPLNIERLISLMQVWLYKSF